MAYIRNVILEVFELALFEISTLHFDDSYRCVHSMLKKLIQINNY
jgi:hypothetical protein